MGCMNQFNDLAILYPENTLVSPDIVFLADLLEQQGCRYQLPLTDDGMGGFIVNSIYDSRDDVYFDCYGSIRVSNSGFTLHDGTNIIFPQTEIFQCLYFNGGISQCPDFGICWGVKAVPATPGFNFLEFWGIKSCIDIERVNDYDGWQKCRQCVEHYYPCKPNLYNFELLNASSVFDGIATYTWTLDFQMEINYPECCMDTGNINIEVFTDTPNANFMGATPTNVTITAGPLISPIVGQITYKTIAFNIEPTIFEIRISTDLCLSDSMHFTFPTT
jgi:hypothetical protein